VLAEIFGVSKPIIAMVHLPGLPGRPRHSKAAGMGLLVETAARDLAALRAAGVDGLLFCNEADLPYQLQTGPEIAAGMASVIGQVRREIFAPFGVNIVWDPMASLATAAATGACFIREVVSGAYESDHGLMQPSFAAIAAYRERIGAGSVALFGNITPEFASTVGRRGLPARARSAAFLGVDVILISGQITGTPTDLDEVRMARAAVPGTPVVANTGVRADTVADVLGAADGAIVGTSLKYEGVTWNGVDPDRAARFMDAARAARARLAAADYAAEG
jgi:uncharacterized protein